MCDGPKKYSSKPENKEVCQQSSEHTTAKCYKVSKSTDFQIFEQKNCEKVKKSRFQKSIEVGPNLQVVTVSPEWTRKTVKSSEP